MSKSTSLSAPLGGWNARDAWGDMDKSDAVSMTNWWPGTSDLMVRKGYSQFSTGYSSQVESLLVYAGAATDKLFSVSGTNIYNATSGGSIGAAVVSSLTSARFEYQNIATSGGNFMLCVNAVDKLRGYDGTTWWADGDATHDITGFDTVNAKDIILFKNRIWMIEKNSLKAWYLPTSSIAGAAQQFPLQSIARLGGTLVAMGVWTLDAGFGIDDMLVFVTSKGEIIVYRGTDPASATSWMLAGIWQLGSPVGNRCLMKFGGDLLILSQDGLLPLASALQSSRLDPRVALSNKIQWAISNAVTTYGSTFGWEICYFPKANMLLLNVPVSVGAQEQYVMNTITLSWCRFTGLNANCWTVFEDDLYFGGSTYVGKAWNNFDDDGNNITAEVNQAFSYFSASGRSKRFTMIRPMLSTNGSPYVFAKMNVDFNVAGNFSPLNIVPAQYATWDNAVWDSAVWGGDLSLSRQWQGVTGIGFSGGISLQTITLGAETHWVSTDIVYELGGIL